MKSIVAYITVIICVFLLFAGCEKQLKYSKIPAIEFESFRLVRKQVDVLSQDSGDTVIVNIRYQDGDGDLGLANDDTSSANDNYIMNVYSKSKGDNVFYPLIFNPSFNGKFPKLTTDNSVGPIDGVLGRGLFIEYSSVDTNTTLMFEIKILDRAKNESNTIRTPPVVVHIP